MTRKENVALMHIKVTFSLNINTAHVLMETIYFWARSKLIYTVSLKSDSLWTCLSESAPGFCEENKRARGCKILSTGRTSAWAERNNASRSQIVSSLARSLASTCENIKSTAAGTDAIYFQSQQSVNVLNVKYTMCLISFSSVCIIYGAAWLLEIASGFTS